MNPILNQLGQNNVMSMINMVRNSGNPQAMLNQLAQTNPQIRDAMNYAKMVGDPKTAFYQAAQQKGVDPESILSMIRK